MTDKTSPREFAIKVANGEILSGLTSPADRRMLLSFIKEYDALKARADKLESALEIYAMTNEIFPEYGNVAREALKVYRGEE